MGRMLSIPSGAIKSELVKKYKVVYDDFQFLLVRLREYKDD